MKIKVILFYTTLLLCANVIRAQEIEISADSLMNLGFYHLKYDSDTLHIFENPNNINGTDSHCYSYYKDGKKISYKCFHDNNKISFEILFDENGKQTGKETRWYYSGKISYQSHWKNGMMNGKYQTWNKAGNIVKDGVLKNGSGILNEYWNDGIIKKKTWVKENGVLIKTQAFCNDTLIEYEINHTLEEQSLIYYDCNTAKIYSEGLLKNGNEDGEWKYYDNKGNLDYVSVYRKGVLLKKYQYENGIRIDTVFYGTYRDN